MYRGIYTAPPTEEQGIQMIYLPDRKAIRFDGWFNGRQNALQAVELPLCDFLRGLGVSLEDCRQALEGFSATDQSAYPTTMPPPNEHISRSTAESVSPAASVPPRTGVVSK